MIGLSALNRSFRAMRGRPERAALQSCAAAPLGAPSERRVTNLAGAAAEVHKHLALARAHDGQHVGEAPRIHLAVGVRPEPLQDLGRRQRRPVVVGGAGGEGLGRRGGVQGHGGLAAAREPEGLGPRLAVRRGLGPGRLGDGVAVRSGEEARDGVDDGLLVGVERAGENAASVRGACEGHRKGQRIEAGFTERCPVSLRKAVRGSGPGDHGSI